MFDDSRELSPSSSSIFSQNSRARKGLFPRSREVFMDPSANTEFGNGSGRNSGLLRFRSAPSSVLENFTHGVEKSAGSGSRFNLRSTNGGLISQGSLNLEDSGNKGFVNGFSGLPPQYPRKSSGAQLVDGGLLGSNLMRQNSSPPGLFSRLTPQNGYAAMKGYRMAVHGGHGDMSLSSNRLKSPLSYSSGRVGMLSQITEVENESNAESCEDDEKPGNGNADTRFFGHGFPFASWSDPPNFAENLNGLKRELDNDANLFAAANTQVGDMGTQPQSLSHPLSLQKTDSAAIAAMEKLSNFPDTVPWNIRAKRGCATHPRSIAERVRRTRISERMRKLQELVPNMDKQTNTADMLDFAVEYIKDLQRQYKTLTDCRDKCKCSAMKKPASNQSLT